MAAPAAGRSPAASPPRDGAVRHRHRHRCPDGPPDRRVFRLDGAAPRSQAEIAARVAAVWLTPQMDRLFQEGASGRRRFLDRLVWALEPGHAREVAAHDTAMAQRNRLLAEGRPTASWLAGLEDAMARHAVAATAARMALVARLNAALAAGCRRLPGGPHDAAVPDRRPPGRRARRWRSRTGCAPAWPPPRARDAAAGSAALGAHRADMALADAATGTPAALASTGEQKALLIGVDAGPCRADRRGARLRRRCCCWTSRRCISIPTAARRCSPRWPHCPRRR